MPADVSLRAWEDFDANLLRIPINGKVYTIPAVGIRTGALLNGALGEDEAAQAALSSPEAWYRAVLGSAYDEMLADDCPAPAVDRAALCAATDFRHGRVAALMAWEAGQSPEALAAIMAATNQIATSHAQSGSEMSTATPNTGSTNPAAR